MRITKVYTRTGDKGRTHLAGGVAIAKDHLRIETYGTVDELNAIVGLVRAFIEDLPEKVSKGKPLDEELHRIQDRLFDVGAIMATAPDKIGKNTPEITAEEVRHLETLMDDCQKELEPLKEFILPGGGKVAAFLHQARTVCRRAERLSVRLNREESVPEGALQYLNRLSDVFFVLGRWIALADKAPETLWKRSPDE
ncbi:MAG: cob(I)yrinic acid a,c-diamide adenosyltransferase [Nitrospira sp.]|nr:cob(I)yrinic acid a,c-diamide adenosyltransferase [Candidatus Manganitrophaceae bacterium]HIL35643.1 cob(I)yrinic acid a,c-diamide adenosyltransferase [Candidatus Manganitrophaceae bacterium]